MNGKKEEKIPKYIYNKTKLGEREESEKNTFKIKIQSKYGEKEGEREKKQKNM